MENEDVLVKVEGLSKKFCKDLKTSLWYGLKDLHANMFGNRSERLLRPKEFWALQDINFELRRGECLGLIGHNGAGKSTLLKILNGLINPDAGKVTIKGRVGALIELGAGFNPILTGRENIYNNGAILGFSRKEINEKLEEIIAFAELEEFIDMPVQHYSSGMKVRLGFAVAAQMKPDVLLIDEVLAVGDLGFMLKCFKTIDTLLPKTAIIFVSHTMPQISRLCNSVILLEKGKPIYNGEHIAEALDLYYAKFNTNNTSIVFTDGSLELIDTCIISKESPERKNGVLNWGENLELYFKFKIKKGFAIPKFGIQILDKEQRPVAILEKNTEYSDLIIQEDYIQFSVLHENLQISKGFYTINVSAMKTGNLGFIYRQNDVIGFQIKHDEEIWEPFLLKARYSNIKKTL